MKTTIALAFAALVSACTYVQPVAVIGENGEVFKGSVTASASEGGHFTATNGKLTCSGNYNAFTNSLTISFPVICTDGRKGFGTAVRDASGVTGSGNILMNDGTKWSFVFGPIAHNF